MHEPPFWLLEWQVTIFRAVVKIGQQSRRSTYVGTYSTYIGWSCPIISSKLHTYSEPLTWAGRGLFCAVLLRLTGSTILLPIHKTNIHIPRTYKKRLRITVSWEKPNSNLPQKWVPPSQLQKKKKIRYKYTDTAEKELEEKSPKYVGTYLVLIFQSLVS